jgi:chromosome segregation ATPase
MKYNQISMNDEQLDKIFNAIQKIDSRLAHVEEDMATRDDIAQLRDEMNTGFDQIASRLDDDDTERGALQSEVNRHDTQINEIADRIGLKLSKQA